MRRRTVAAIFVGVVAILATVGNGLGIQRITGRTPFKHSRGAHSVGVGLTTDQKAGGSSPPGCDAYSHS